MNQFRAVPLNAVRITDGYIQNALEKEREYLLSLDTGRLLAGFYENAGLKTPFVRYGGWENRLIGGHTLGHYLSALSLGSVNAGYSESTRALFRKKIADIVNGLLLCQNNSKGESGFLWGAPLVCGGAEAQFDNVEREKTNIKRDAWVPWYTMHKILAGLIDAARYTGSQEALVCASLLGDWVCGRVLKWSPSVRRKVLSVEYGGMNDCLYDLYALTGKEEHAKAAHVFDEEALFDEILSGRENALKDRHANTTIPKFLGALKRYAVMHGTVFEGKRVNAARYLRAAESFFMTVTTKHTYVTGGNSEWEHFGSDGVLDRERTNCNCETCNVYNMLKLARLLFESTGKKEYLDYYDRAFTNAILSSQNPQTGMTTYFQPMAGGFFKVFSTPYDKFWCCTGSGMENMAKLGDGVYYSDGKNLAVALFLPSVFRSERIGLTTKCDFPFDDAYTVTVERAESAFILYLRIPDWAAGAIRLEKNGQVYAAEEKDGFLAVSLSEGDRLRAVIPVGYRAEGLPDSRDAYAFLYGNAVLGAKLGREDMRLSSTGVDVSVPAKRLIDTECVYFENADDVIAHPEKYFVREGDRFTLTGGDIPFSFGLLYRNYDERYAVYLRLRSGEREADEETRDPLDTVQVGYGQYENDELHDMREQNSVSDTANGTCRYARSGGYFEYDLRIDPVRKNYISVELSEKDNGKPLKITVGETVLLAGYLFHAQGEKRYRREFPIPPEATAKAVSKQINGEIYTVLPVRFEGLRGRRSARVCEFLYVYTE